MRGIDFEEILHGMSYLISEFLWVFCVQSFEDVTLKGVVVQTMGVMSFRLMEWATFPSVMPFY